MQQKKTGSRLWRHRDLSVWVAEDDQTLLKFFNIHLTRYFARVVVVEDGQKALSRLRREKCDLLLTDVRMPCLGGVALSQGLMALGIWVPVVAITGAELSGTQQRPMGLLFDAVLYKPFEFKKLDRALQVASELARLYRQLRAGGEGLPCDAQGQVLRNLVGAAEQPLRHSNPRLLGEIRHCQFVLQQMVIS